MILCHITGRATNQDAQKMNIVTQCYREHHFCVYCVTVDTLVIVWLNFGVCMYVYEDSNFGNLRLPYVYAYAHIWLKHQACEATITKVAIT